MPSVFALRAVFGASLGLGALDLVWINTVLAPRLSPEPSRAQAVASAPAPITVANAPPAMAPPLPPPPSRVALAGVYFATRSARLDSASRAELARFVASAGPGAAVVLEGHADQRGEASFNLSLSRARAVAVRTELVRLGLTPDQIELGYAGEGTASGDELWRDRRVDLQLRGAR